MTPHSSVEHQPKSWRREVTRSVSIAAPPDAVSSAAFATAPRLGERVTHAAIMAVGAGTMIIVALDGSPVWQFVRLAATVALFAAALIGGGRGSPARQAGVAFAVGLFGAAIGIGIGLPHLAKAGWHVLTVAGLLCLLGGAFLLVSGGVTLVREARRWWRRALVAPALIATVFVVVWSLGQAVAATNAPPTSVGSTTPADVGLRYRDVKFRTGDGVTLSGWYVPSMNGAAVVLLHGAGSTRSGVLDHAVVLARHGYGVVLFDARGHGRSDGRAMDFGWYGDLDTSAAVSFVQAQPDVDDGRIAVVGMSMGGEEAIGAAAADPRIQAVVAEGATNRVSGDKLWLSDEYGWRGAVQEGIERLTYATTDLLTDAEPPVALRDAIVQITPRPVLLIAAGTVANEGDAGRYFASASPDSVTLWIVPDAGHTAALDTDPEQWERRVTSFLADALSR